MNNFLRELWVQRRRVCSVGRHFILKMVQERGDDRRKAEVEG